MSRRDNFKQTAEETYVDPENIECSDREDVQGVLEDICEVVNTSASPGFSFGRQGNNSAGTFLNRPGGTPSNRTGVNFGLSDGSLDLIAVGTQNLDTYTVRVWQHEGNFINPVLIAEVNIVASRREIFEKDVDYTQLNPLTKNEQIAVEIEAGTARNPGVDLQFSGSMN